PHDVSMIFYTSGTTADPKGVLHTPSTIGALIQCHRRMAQLSPDDRSILQFPLTHIGGIVMFVAQQIVVGSSTVFMDRFDPELALDLTDRPGAPPGGGPPAVVQTMFNAPNYSLDKVRSVRTSGLGAADVSPELMREAGVKLGAVTHRSYGMTECPMLTSGRRDEPDAKRHGTDGRPLPSCEARVVGEAGRPPGPNVEGDSEALRPRV